MWKIISKYETEIGIFSFTVCVLTSLYWYVGHRRALNEEKAKELSHVA